MQQPARTRKVISQVAQRLHWASVGRQFYRWLLIAAALYGVLLIVNRMLGLAAMSLTPVSMVAIPIGALVISLLWHGRPTAEDAARRIDQHGKTKDLFLTYSMLDGTAGQYQSLVSRDAEARAPKVTPQDVVPLGGLRQSGHLLVAGLLLLLAVLYLPRFDPLGRVAEASLAAQDEQQRQDDKQATALRVEKIRESQLDETDASRIDKSIDDMTKAIRAMKLGEPGANLKRLNTHQRGLGKKWRRLGAEKLSKLLNESDSLQDFGGRRSEKLRKWQQELQTGSDGNLRQELSKLAEDLQAAAAEKDPVKRNEMLRELKERLRDVERFASEKAGSPELAAAMQRAMRQLEDSQREGLSSEMIDAVKETLALAKLELEQVAKSAQELEKLEQSLQVLQMAKQLNEDGQLDGEACSECQSLADYADLFAEMMGDEISDGGGMGNQGFGEGGEAPEDDAVATDYKTERSKSALQAGKVLLSMQAKGISDSGEVEKNYQKLVGRVKQGVSEAILQEQVPPGYHDAIRSYFDTIGGARQKGTVEDSGAGERAKGGAEAGAEPTTEAADTDSDDTDSDDTEGVDTEGGDTEGGDTGGGEPAADDGS